MKRGIELPTGGTSLATLLLGVVAVAAVFIAITLYVRSDTGRDIATADSSSAPAAAGYIKIGDIKGESTDSSHEEWINLLSVSQSITRPLATGTSGSTRTRGALSFGDIVLVKEIDKATPKLMEALSTGQVIPTVLLDVSSVTSTDARRSPYLQYELTNVLVTNYRISGSVAGDDRPTETLSLNFEEIKVTYTEPGKTGSTASTGKVEYSWNVAENVRK